MTAKQKNDLLLKNAVKAMRRAVQKVVAERKLRGQPVLIWENGKVVRRSADRI